MDAWLFDVVLPHWFNVGLDANSGVPVECLDMSGAALGHVPRRGRVMPRQIFTFVRALRLGLAADDPAFASKIQTTLTLGVNTLLEVSLNSEKGFPSLIDKHGRGLEYGAKLYDHAFVALAGSEAHALGIKEGLTLAETALDLIEEHFADSQFSGYQTVARQTGPKLSNPHMHLIEASLLHHAIGGTGSKARIRTIADLATNHFLSRDSGFILEEVAEDLSVKGAPWIEPGHCYEWAYLLHCAANVLNDGALETVAKDLFERSETFVESDGLIMDVVNADAPTYRLWPQLERLRCLATFDRTDPIQDLISIVDTVYLSKGPKAGWMDKVDANRHPLSEAVPASMLYHLMTALPVITRPDIQI